MWWNKDEREEVDWGTAAQAKAYARSVELYDKPEAKVELITYILLRFREDLWNEALEGINAYMAEARESAEAHKRLLGRAEKRAKTVF